MVKPFSAHELLPRIRAVLRAEPFGAHTLVQTVRGSGYRLSARS